MVQIIRMAVCLFHHNEKGAALVEYGMLVGLIAVICITAVTLLGQEISDAFTTIATDLSGLIPPAPAA